LAHGIENPLSQAENELQEAARSRTERTELLRTTHTQCVSCQTTGVESGDLQVLSMGRAGIEPATLGLKVRPKKLRRTATNGNFLQLARIETATNCSEMRGSGDKPFTRVLTRGIVCVGNNLNAARADGNPFAVLLGHNR
jgi:hypothetical protein